MRVDQPKRLCSSQHLAKPLTLRQRLRLVLLQSFIVIGGFSASSHAADELLQQSAQLKQVGQGHFRYLFWSVYDAALATRDGQFLSVQQSAPLALTLTYQRDITTEEFVSATLDQWQHVFGEISDKQRQWAAALQRIWPDVRQDDHLSCVIDRHGFAHFYLNQQVLGTIEDPLFSEQFLAIWLDERTSAPKLRRQLLGQ